MANTIAIVSALIAFFSLAFAIFLAIRSKTVYRPRLTLSAGRTDPDQISSQDKNLRESRIVSWIYLLDLPVGSYAILYHLCRLENKSRIAIKNVKVKYEYPLENVVHDDAIFYFKNSLATLKLDMNIGLQNRQVSQLDEFAQVFYEFPIIEPDGAVMLGDLIRIKIHKDNVHISDNIRSHVADYFRPSALLNRLQKLDNFMDFLRVPISIVSENHSRIDKSIDIYFLRGKENDDIQTTLDDLNDAIVNNELPRAGDVFRISPFFKLNLKVELAEVIFPHFNRDSKADIYFENYFKSTVGVYRQWYPIWDYRNSSDSHYLGLKVVKKAKAESTLEKTR